MGYKLIPIHRIPIVAYCVSPVAVSCRQRNKPKQADYVKLGAQIQKAVLSGTTVVSSSNSLYYISNRYFTKGWIISGIKYTFSSATPIIHEKLQDAVNALSDGNKNKDKCVELHYKFLIEVHCAARITTTKDNAEERILSDGMLQQSLRSSAELTLLESGTYSQATITFNDTYHYMGRLIGPIWLVAPVQDKRISSYGNVNRPSANLTSFVKQSYRSRTIVIDSSTGLKLNG